MKNGNQYNFAAMSAAAVRDPICDRILPALVKTASEAKTAAQKYALLGWKVFPVHYPHDGRCSCGDRDCQSVGKHPMTPNGYKGASVNVALIESWWRESADANVGIAT